jgi:uncharacterized membrane protein
MIRQYSHGSTAMYLRILRVLGVVVARETDPARRAVLVQHADLVLDDAGRTVSNARDLDDIRASHAALRRWLEGAPLTALLDTPTFVDA